MHLLASHLCLRMPGPPNLILSRHEMHSPQSSALQPAQKPRTGHPSCCGLGEGRVAGAAASEGGGGAGGGGGMAVAVCALAVLAACSAASSAVAKQPWRSSPNLAAYGLAVLVGCRTTWRPPL